MITIKNNIEWIDGAKGIAIISVILLHSLPCLKEIGWIWHLGQAVPVFLFISAYLTSIHFVTIPAYFTRDRFLGIIKKIFIPYFVVLLIQIVCLYLCDSPPTLKTIIKGGGLGPGSYYPWVYLQTWLLTPFMTLLVRKTPIILSLIITMFFSIVSEYVFCILQNIEHVEALYRMTISRYIMVLYLGVLWPTLNKKYYIYFYVLGLLAALFMLNACYLNLFDMNFIVPPFWTGYHWYTAFYVVLMIVLLKRIKYKEPIKLLGKYSWYIFLFQLFCFSF